MNTKQTYLQAIASEQRSNIQRENLAFTQELAALTTTRSKEGEGSKLDADVVRAEFVQQKLLVNQTELAAYQARVDLGTLLGLTLRPEELQLSDPLPEEISPEVTLEELVMLASTYRLDLQAAREATSAAWERLQTERRRVWQLVRAGVGLEREQKTGSEGGDFIIGPGVAIELPLFDQNHAQIARRQFEHEKTVKELQALERELFQEAARTIKEVMVQAERARAYALQVVPLQEGNLKVAREAYREGAVSLLSVLQAQQSLVLARQEQLDAVIAAAQAAAELERVAGVQMEQNWLDSH